MWGFEGVRREEGGGRQLINNGFISLEFGVATLKNIIVAVLHRFDKVEIWVSIARSGMEVSSIKVYWSFTW